MRIGLITNSEFFIPLAYTLKSQTLPVAVFYAPSMDAFIHQKVHAFLEQSKIPFSEEKDKTADLYQWLQQGKFDVCFVIGYKYLIRLDKLKDCKTLLFNIHFGPLPAFKGPVPVFWQLKLGVKKLGLAIHKLSERFDSGPVVWKKETDNLPHYSCHLVEQLFSQLCVEGVFYILQHLLNNQVLPLKEQKPAAGAYYKKPELKDVLINWQKMSAEEICNLVRACNPWNKGALTLFQSQEVKLMDAAMLPENRKGNQEQKQPGIIMQNGNRLQIGTMDGKSILVNMLFYQDCFVAAYDAKHWGFVMGKAFG